MARSRSVHAFVAMEERMQLEQERREEEVLLIHSQVRRIKRENEETREQLLHSQVRRIKREDEETREKLLKLQLLETRPGAGAGGQQQQASPSRSLSPLRRAGNAIPVGDWA